MAETPKELIAPPWSRVEWSIMLAARDIRRTFDEVFLDFDLNLSGVALMALLYEHGSLSQTNVGKCLGMGRASAGALIDDLEKRKLVDRKADPKDKRVWLVGLTDEGKELAAQLEQRDLDLRDLFREGVTREERSHLAGVLQKFRANLNKVRKDHSKVDYKGE